MNVIANLNQGDLKDAVVQYLKQKGFNTIPENIRFDVTRETRPGEVNIFTAVAECNLKPQTNYRGDNDELQMPTLRSRS